MNCKETFLFTYKSITTWTEVYHSCMNSTGKLGVFLFVLNHSCTFVQIEDSGWALAIFIDF